MTEPIEKQITVPFGEGSYTLNFVEWGDAANPDVLFCAHGFTRNGRDFDRIGASLQHRYRVVCIDFPGRGKSGNLPPEAYMPQNYVPAVMALLQYLGIAKVNWLGTSMGGIVGMVLAANPALNLVRKLILNDVGAVFHREGIVSVAMSSGNGERFQDLQEAERYFRDRYAAWGPLPDEEWRHIALHSTHRADGGYELAYDPNIAAVAKKNRDQLKDMDIWPVFEAIQCPVLVLHGKLSQMLTDDDVEQMKARGKQVTAVDFPGIGHTPPLRTAAEIELIESWLAKD
jgi:pimeloyl-ACP methyl ester carboxylesterase